MKIFDSKKQGNTRTVKLFGKTFITTTSEIDGKLQEFFGGILSVRTKSSVNDEEIKNISLFGKKILSIATLDYKYKKW